VTGVPDLLLFPPTIQINPFGFACAGNSLARMEAQVALQKLVTRFHSIERAGPFVRGGRARFRGFRHYPIALH
jgi:cytochrome P450